MSLPLSQRETALEVSSYLTSSSDDEMMGQLDSVPLGAASKPESNVGLFAQKWGKWIFCAFFFAYTVAACVLSSQRDKFEEAIPLIVMFVLYLLKRICTTFRTQVKDMIRGPYDKIHSKFESPKTRKLFLWGTFAIFIVGLAVSVGVVIAETKEYDRLVGFGGIAVLLLIGFACSKHRTHIRARTVVVALMMQFTMGLIVMRTDLGYLIVKWVSDTMATFLGYIAAGSSFVFGGDMVMVNANFALVEGKDGADLWAILPPVTNDGSLVPPNAAPAHTLSYFAFMVIPTVIYFGAFSSMLYHAHLVQPMIKGLGLAYGGLMGTTVPESVNAACNIFLGQTEAPLLIRSFLPDMSDSEIHAVVVGGFATVSGGIMAAYIGLGIPAGHLISSVVMSSAGSLGFAKLLWPETEKTGKTDRKKLNDCLYGKSQHTNLIEAAAAGAADTVGLALCIGATLIAFLSIIAAINALLGWLCFMINVSGPEGADVTIELILGYIFAPIAFTMGITEWRESVIIGQLIGVKLMATEMTAYIELGKYMEMNAICAANMPHCNLAMTLSERSVIIASYALCGFGNFGSIGILIGGLTPMAPEKRTSITKTVGRGLVAGTLTNLTVATIAGIVVDPTRTFK